jgi:tetratricopeptide (TPR) repeat protein
MSLNKEKLFFVFVIFVIGVSLLNVNSTLGDEDEENFSFFLDNFQYSPRDVIEISGWVKTVTASEIFIEITNPDDQIIIQENSSLKEIQEIDHTIPTLGTEWNTFGFYQIKLFYGNETQSRLFGFGDFDPKEFEPQITLDKENYSWTDTVKIMVLSPNDNQNNHQTDKIKIDISSSLGTLSDYTLEETGISHGIFEGEVNLTGYSEFDVDGDGRGDDVRGITFGVGPEEGNLAVRPNDNIRISFSSPYFEDEVENIAKIQFNKGEIEWIEKEIDPNEKTIVRVVDPDLKLQPTKKDQIEILVSSHPQGYSELFTLSETENNSGIFEGFIRFIDSPKDDGVLVRSGSIVTAKYEDRTIPPEYSILTLDITANATVIEIVEPHETIPKENGIDVERAEKLIDLGNYLGLLSYSNEILNQNPQNIDALYYKGIALWGYYRNNIGPHPETVETLDTVLAVNPEHIGALYYKAKSLYQIKEYDKALIVINKVLSINPNYKDASAQKQLILDEKINGPNSSSSEVDRLISTAGSLSVRKDYTGAFRVIDQALELEPNNAEALHTKGSIFLRQENYNDALFWIDKALENNSSLVRALHDKGLILFELGNIQESKIWFDRAMSEPGYEEVLDVEFILNNLGRRLFESENYQDSLFWYDKAIDLKPDARYFLNNKVIALNEIGRNYLEEENPKEALIWFEKGLELDPDAVFLLNNKGLAYYHLGENEKAIAAYDKALTIDPSYDLAQENKELVEGSFYETIRPIIFIVIFGSITYGMYYVKKRRQKHIHKTRKIINEPSFSVLKLRWGGSNITYQVIFDKERLLLIRPDKIKSEYENVSLDEILRMDKLNYDIPFYEISQVEMNQSTHGVNGARAGKIMIHYQNKKDSFDILETESFDNCANLARSYLGMKLVIS